MIIAGGGKGAGYIFLEKGPDTFSLEKGPDTFS
jgi:hypothetical protein